MATRGQQVIAGYDGSADSIDALDWAIGEAQLRGVQLTVCHAWTPAYGPGTDDRSDPARQRAETVLAAGVRHAQAAAAPVEIRQLLACGPATRVLCELSAEAGLIAVGSRGLGGVTGLQLGSVSHQVAAHARAAVTVVRGRWRPGPGQAPGPVVVGADGSTASLAAVELAVTEATLRDVPLVAVCALSDSAGVLGIARSVAADFAAALDRVQAMHPGVVLHRRIEPGTPRSALLAAATHGQLLVVGARGRGGLAQMMLGSVSLAILQHATCPVTVVHQS